MQAPNTSFQLASANVKSITLVPGAEAVEVMKLDGTYWDFDGTTWTFLAGPRLVVTTPATAAAGQPVPVTVSILDAQNNLVTGYTGAVHFSSTDSGATLPMDYTFTAADAGTHTFSVAFTAVGTESVNVVDLADPSLSGQTWATTDVSIPTPASAPCSIILGPDGNLWFTQQNAADIGRITPSGVVTEYPIPSGNFAASLTVDANGTIWFTEAASNNIGEITFAAGGGAPVIQEFPFANSATTLNITWGIATTPDGNVWFANSNLIGEMSPSGAVLNEFQTPAGFARYSLIVGPDGNLWFADFDEANIGKVNLNAATGPVGMVTEYPLPPGSSPLYLVNGPDGAMWFVEDTPLSLNRITISGTISQIGSFQDDNAGGFVLGPDGNFWATDEKLSLVDRITPSGQITSYPTPTPNGDPECITVGPNNDLWYTEGSGNKIANITLTSPGQIQVTNNPFPLATWTTTEDLIPTPASAPCSIVLSPDGNLWFTQLNAADIGRITPSGVVTEYPIPSGNFAAALTVGANGTIWFTEDAGNYIGQITVATAGGAPVIQEFPFANSATTSNITWGIAATPDGNVWFANSNFIGEMSPSGAVLNEFQTSAGFARYSLIVGPDGNLWFADFDEAKIGKVNLNAATGSVGMVTEYPLPPGSSPLYLVNGPDGAIWFVENTPLSLNRITTSGTISQIASFQDDNAGGLVLGPDGNFWATDENLSQVDRITPSGQITSYPTPTPNGDPYCITVGPNNDLWYTEASGNKIAHLTLTSGSQSQATNQVPTPWSPCTIILGPDGNLWFTELDAADIGMMTPSGVVTEHPIPSGNTAAALTVGPDNSNTIWFTEASGNNIGEITIASGGGAPQIQEFPFANNATAPNITWGITQGPDGDIWFANSNFIGQMSPSGTMVNEFTTPPGYDRFSLIVGPDQDLWFADYSEAKIGTMNLNAAVGTIGTVTEYALPAGQVSPTFLVNGADGALWFADDTPLSLNRITTSGVITQIASFQEGSAGGLVVGPDGNFWLTDGNLDLIDRITPTGQITSYPTPTPSSLPRGITVGPNNDIWYTEADGNNIAEMTLTTPGVTSVTVMPTPSPLLASSARRPP